MTADSSAKQPIVFIHDAAIDEYMSMVLLSTLDDVDVLAVVVVNADCIAAPAMDVTARIRAFTKMPVRIGLSGARGLNPFPWEYRSDCVRESQIGALKSVPGNPEWPPFPNGEELLAGALREATAPVTALVTSPMTPLAEVLRREPALAQKIGRIIWMGGAVHVGGNLDPATVPNPPWNPYAEWNAFWDPDAVDYIFRQTEIPIVMFPLDMTNQAAITASFMGALDEQAKTSTYSRLAYQSYQLVAAESFYDMWDVVTTCYIPRPDLFEPPARLLLTIDTDLAGQMGTIRVDPRGRAVDVVENFDGDGSAFYDYVLAQFNR